MPEPRWQKRGLPPATPLIALCVAVFYAAIIPAPVSAQGPSVGLYSDAAGSGCSLSDNSQGFFNAYVVVRPGPQGVSAVQFSAPPPPCFTGVYVGDQTVAGTLVLGNSQTGVSVSLTTCSAFTTHVLTIQYFGYGTTPPCCEYPVLPDPLIGEVTVVDCFFNTEPATGVVSMINADGSCPCAGNSPPNPPDSPIPAHLSGNVVLDQVLSWTATDPDDNIAGYDVYFGTDPSPPLAATGLTTASYDPGPLEPVTTYYWRIVVRDVLGSETSGDVWMFSTRPQNSPPGAPRFPVPADGSTDRPIDLSLQWSCTDIDEEVLAYDVYFGATAAPPLVSSNQGATNWPVSALAFSTTYYWRIVARDPPGHETEGPLWSFTTRPENYAPNAPGNPVPANGATSQSVDVALRWSATDPDGDDMTFDVYLGTINPPPLAASGIGTVLYQPSSLDYATKYYWRIVARDEHGASREGPVWSFTTRLMNYPPTVPAVPVPSNGATFVSITPALSWQCSDPDGEPLFFDVYLGAESPPPLVASSIGAKSFTPGLLAYATRYYWRIVARDARGAETTGPAWSFTTQPNPVQGSIGIYGDVDGNVCSLADVSSGIVNAYVVVRPGPQGVTAVQFSAPMPSCFTGTYLGDMTAAGTLVIGNSQTGVSVSLTGCSFEAEHVLTIRYFGSGTTPACCELPILPDPTVDVFAIVDCAFETEVARGVASRFNADVSCPCSSNNPPGVPSNPVPSHASTNRPWTQHLAWQCLDPDGDPLRYDVSFGTESPPPLAADSVAATSWALDTLAFATTYYWRITARDSHGAVSTGPIWYFATKANAPPNKPTTPSPYHGTSVLDASLLTWNASDPDGQALTYDVYFGTEEDPPLAATGVPIRSWAPGPLQPATRYYWRVVASDGFLTTSSMVWYFTLILQGDADQDGLLTTADASCAFRMSLHDFACGGASGATAADVDCSDWLSPRDARCIHKRVLDGSCSFCDAAGAAPVALSTTPVVTQGSTWEDQDTLVLELNISGVSSFESFLFAIEDDSYGGKGRFLRAERRGASAGWAAVAGTDRSPFAFVGGYTTSRTVIVSAIPFVRIRYQMAASGPTRLRVSGYADDLVGAAPLELSFGGTIPVLISRFDARATDDGVVLAWELGGDETAERFTVLRRADSADLPAIVGEGAVVGVAGSWVDTSVEPGATYHYELLLRTSDGQEFRSQVVTVTMADYALALGQNHPNPFNPTTVIPYTLSGRTPARVRLLILDVSGRVVRTLVDAVQAGGSREVVWDGRDDRGGPVSSGVYFYVLDADRKRLTRKLVLLK
ncbi:MAG TPA: FlgD immunoglobulin-like domain containing protein [Candidatus Krumholzibacteria bacterium]|nr:FlgD immunoglobulin-like domain containing protein [Candidatus Krumholzibacteria bacterium]